MHQPWLDLAHARNVQGVFPSRASPTLPKLLDSAADPLHGMILWDLQALGVWESAGPASVIQSLLCLHPRHPFIPWGCLVEVGTPHSQ